MGERANQGYSIGRTGISIDLLMVAAVPGIMRWLTRRWLKKISGS